MSSKLLILIFSLSFALSQDADQIIFPHTTHIDDVELECTYCHEGITESKSLFDTSFLPTMDFCGECHEDALEEDCEMCHTNPDEADTYPISGSTSGKDFSHLFHLNQFSNCSKCHSGVYEDEGEEIRKSWTESDCNACHSITLPQNHNFNWVSTHGVNVMSQVESNCNMCHEQKNCDACHHLQQFEQKTHPTSYIMLHGFEFKAGMKECSTCHIIEKDCITCHLNQFVMPLDHSNIDWTETDLIIGGEHIQSAYDNPELCQVCHRVSFCERCHQ